MNSPVAILSEAERGGLRRLNIGVGLAHLLQAVLMITLSNDLAFTITGSWLTDDPVSQRGLVEPQSLFDLPLGPVIALFLLLAAVDHLLVASPLLQDRYVGQVSRRRNSIRWTEYSVSSSVMIVLIASLVGIRDIAALVAIFGVNSTMILFGVLMERQASLAPSQDAKDLDWTAFWFGSIAGAVPWLAIAIYTLAGEPPPFFVYIILVVEFVFFMSFALNMWLQYSRIGKWDSVLYAERVFLWLSLGAKSMLAWLIFANVLRA